MLEAHPSVRHLHIIDRNWKKEGGWQTFRHEVALVSAVRACHYDLVINLADQWRSAILTGLSGAPVRIGFAFKKRDNAFWRGCHNHLVTTENHERYIRLNRIFPLCHRCRFQPTVPEPRCTSAGRCVKSAEYAASAAGEAPYIVLQILPLAVQMLGGRQGCSHIDQLAQADRKVILTGTG